MQKILGSLVAVGICLTPLTMSMFAEYSWAQAENSQSQQLRQLIEQAKKQDQQQKYQQAVLTWQQVLTLARQLNDRKAQAEALLGIGRNNQKIGKPQPALDYLNQALTIYKEVGDRSGVADTLSGMGKVYSNIGQPQKALELYQQALPLKKEVGDRSGVADTLNNIGAFYFNIGQLQKALEYYQQALPIKKEVGSSSGVATTLNNIGGVYLSIGQPQKALEYYQQSLPISKEVGDRCIVAITLNNIGHVYLSIGQPQKALEYYQQSLPISKEVGARSGEATTLSNMGGVYLSIGQPQKALEYFQQSLPISKEVGSSSGEATTLNNIGEVYLSIGQPQKALEYFQQSLPISKEVGSSSGEATTLSNLAFVYRDTNHPTEAINNWQQSVEIILQIRRELQQSDRQKFLKDNQNSEIALVDLLIDQKQPERAYEWVHLYTTSDLADYSRLINAKVANPDAQQQIEQWNQKNQQLEFLRQELSKKFTVELSQRINNFQTEINQLAETISLKFPEVAELFETTTTDIARLRANIPEGTVIVQPVLLTEKKYIAIFVLTKNQVKVIKRAINPKELDTLLTQYPEELQTAFTEDYFDNSQKLYDILIRPIEGEIQAAAPTQLSVIATGKFRYIPFESLYDSKTKKFLIQKYPVNNLTRISSRTLQDSQANNQVPRQAVLALGNPFPNDIRHLRGAEAEVTGIKKVLPSSEVYLNDKATLNTFKTQAQRFNFLHIATHGCFIPGGCPSLKMPENTILFADQNLNIADAALLGLKNVSLIILSACRTAVTEKSTGEEVAGIAYLFERAGAKAVIASLWDVNDDSTRQLMVKFYENLNKGMSKGEALRQAKLSLINNPVYSHFYYWSPFILIGNAR